MVKFSDSKDVNNKKSILYYAYKMAHKLDQQNLELNPAHSDYYTTIDEYMSKMREDQLIPEDFNKS